MPKLSLINKTEIKVKNGEIMRDTCSDRLIERAVELWCRKLRDPIFDNGDPTGAGGMTAVIGAVIIQNDKSNLGDIEKSIAVFREFLTTELKRLRDNPGKGEYFRNWLDVDYGPCGVLAKAADKAGIPYSQFSIKSCVGVFSNRVAVSWGYGACEIKHYPLADNRWLLTTLSGSEEDMQKIKTDAMGANLFNWEIEDAN